MDNEEVMFLDGYVAEICLLHMGVCYTFAVVAFLKEEETRHASIKTIWKCVTMRVTKRPSKPSKL